MRTVRGCSEHLDGPRLVMTPVVIGSCPNDSTDEGMTLVYRFYFTLSGGKITAGFEKLRQFDPKPQLLLRIGFQLGFTPYHPLLKPAHCGFVRDSAGIGEDVACGRAIDDGREQRLDFRIALLGPEDADAELENIRICRRGLDAPARLFVN